MGGLPFRGVLAVGMVFGGMLGFFITTKMTFAELLALTGPVTALYFGQFISPPGSVSVPRESVAPAAPNPSAEQVEPPQ